MHDYERKAQFISGFRELLKEFGLTLCVSTGWDDEREILIYGSSTEPGHVGEAFSISIEDLD